MFLSDLEFVAPYPVERGDDQLHFTYLDTVGRPVVVINIKNTVENHIQDFQLKYKFQKVMILKEPLVIVASFFAIFAFIILAVRIDFSLAAEKPTVRALEILIFDLVLMISINFHIKRDMFAQGIISLN